MKTLAVLLALVGLAFGQPHIDPGTHAMLIFEDHMAEEQGLDTLTSIAYSDSIDVTGNLYHTVVLSAVGDTDLDPVIQWSVDGVTWYTEYTGNDLTTGTYQDHWEALCKYVRIGIIAEHGTASTLTGVYYGGR